MAPAAAIHVVTPPLHCYADTRVSRGRTAHTGHLKMCHISQRPTTTNAPSTATYFDLCAHACTQKKQRQRRVTRHGTPRYACDTFLFRVCGRGGWSVGTHDHVCRSHQPLTSVAPNTPQSVSPGFSPGTADPQSDQSTPHVTSIQRARSERNTGHLHFDIQRLIQYLQYRIVLYYHITTTVIGLVPRRQLPTTQTYTTGTA